MVSAKITVRMDEAAVDQLESVLNGLGKNLTNWPHPF